MKSHGFFSFIVPPGLLLVFPELRLSEAHHLATASGRRGRI
jgi:hypothetical protein